MYLLVKFHVETVMANRQNGDKYWTEHGDSYQEWLATFNLQDGISSSCLGSHGIIPDLPVLMDGNSDDVDSQRKDSFLDSQATDKGK